MNETLLRSFLADCKANSENDAPRLILADWLEENADTEADRARGEFIRLQCRLAHEDEEEPDPESLQERVNTLAQQFKEEWLADFEQNAEMHAYFMRGFPRVAAHHLEDLVSWSLTAPPLILAWVEGVHLMGDDSDNPSPELWFSPALTSPLLDGVTELTLGDVDFDEACKDRFFAWTGLQHIRHLSFECNSYPAGFIPRLLASPYLGTLLTLGVPGWDLGTGGFADLIRSPALAGLRDLDIAYNKISDAGLSLLASAPFHATLVDLVLDGNILDDRATEILAGTPLPALRHLSLRCCQIGPAGAAHLASAPWLSGLRYLRLVANNFGDGLARLLAGPLDQLRSLDLDARQAQDAFHALLSGCPPLPRLRKFWLAPSQLSPSFLALLLERWPFPALRHLSISSSPVGDEGARLLAGWPGIRQLRQLDLMNCQLTEVGIRALLGSPHLEPRTRITLGGNRITPELRAEALRSGRAIVF
jgi:uncharacterized protein (TIGR02996 family)